MTRIIKTLLTVALLVTAVTSVGYAFDFSELENSIKERTLDNGLKFIVLEQHDAPVVSFVIWANVGSVDDPKGYTGLAHMFEHMAFKGTMVLGSKDIDAELALIAIEDSLFMELRSERLKGRLADSVRLTELTAAYDAARDASYELVEPNAFSELVRKQGGVGMNAGTGQDQTIYFYSLPSNKVELWMALDSERFLSPVLREMYRERDVVAEERRMRVENSPFGRLFEEMLGLAYKAHPYGVRGIGHMSDIENFSRDEAEAFYDRYYGPSNLVVAIVGDVKAKDVFKMAEEYWGRIPYRPAPDRIATVEPEQLGERRMVMYDPAQPIYAAAWHIPELTHPDRPAIDAMLDYLGQGRTSLIYKSMIKEKKISSQAGVFTGLAGDKYPGLIAAYALPSPDHNNAECEAEIDAQVEWMKSDLIAAEELEEIAARAKSNFVNGLGSNRGLAMQLAAYQTYWGDWREMFRELDRINAVTPEDIQRVAKEYLTNKNRTVVVIETEES
jgi:predicted Zn-dependent peptidase